MESKRCSRVSTDCRVGSQDRSRDRRVDRRWALLLVAAAVWTAPMVAPQDGQGSGSADRDDGAARTRPPPRNYPMPLAGSEGWSIDCAVTGTTSALPTAS